MSIIGEKIDPFVAIQVQVRQKLQGKQARDNTDLTLLNNNNAWLKLASSVRIVSQTDEEKKANTNSIATYNTGSKEFEDSTISSGEQRLRDIGINNTGEFTGNQLAKKAVLFNTLTEINPSTYNDKNEKTSQGSHISRFGVSSTNSLWNDNSYGLGGTDFGIVPAPGLISAKIDCKNRGSIREATVELKAYNLFQFELIELLYLRLGYSMLLEWGWDKYLDKDENFKPVGNTLTEDLWFQDFSTYNYRKVIKAIARYRKLYDGNYDGFLGKVVNFDWSFQPDGTYDITLKLITIGDVIESLKVNLPSQLTTAAQLDEIFTTGNEATNKLLDVESPIVTNAGSSTLSIDLYNDIASSTPSKWWGWKTNYYSWFANAGYSKEFRIKEQTEEEKEKNKELQYPPTGVDSNKYTYFLTFGALLEKLNNLCVPSINGGKILEFDVSGDNICSAFPNQISFDPKVCLIAPQFTENISLRSKQDYKNKPTAVKNDHGSFAKLKDFFEVEKDTNVLYGNIMNIYLNYDFISNTLQKNTNDGEISIYKFLEDICNNINSSLGGINKLEPIIEDDNIIKIIDQNPIPGIETSTKFKNRFGQTIPFEIYGFSPSGSTSNFVRDFGFKTKIGPELASMITVGATAQNKTTKNYDGTAFSKWNDGLEDAYAITYDDPDETALNISGSIPEYFPLTAENLVKMSKHWKDPNKCVVDESYLPDGLDFLDWFARDQKETTIYGITNTGVKDVDECPVTEINYTNVTWAEYVREAKSYKKVQQIINKDKPSKEKPKPLTNYLAWLLEAFGGNTKGNFKYSALYFYLNDDFYSLGKTLFKSFITGVNNEVYNQSKNPSNTVGFIPADLSLTIDGLSGVKIYNALSINQRFLPRQYPIALNFIITKVNHDISSNNWGTSLHTISVPKTLPFDASLLSFAVLNTVNTEIINTNIANLNQKEVEAYNSLGRIEISNLKVSQTELENIKKVEGFRSNAYDDKQPNATLTASTPIQGTLTIGYGFTKPTFPELKWDSTMTKAEADALLLEKITGYENRVKNVINVPLRQEEFDALVSIAWNAGSIGNKSMGQPTPLQNTINDKKYREAAEIIPNYRITAKGFVGVVPGLVNRRAKEYQTYLSGYTYTAPPAQPVYNPGAYTTGPKF